MINEEHVFEDSDVKKVTAENGYVHIRFAEDINELVLNVADLNELLARAKSKGKTK